MSNGEAYLVCEIRNTSDEMLIKEKPPDELLPVGFPAHDVG